MVELHADGLQARHVVLGVADRVHLVGRLHERGKAVLHAEQLVDREGMEAELLTLDDRAEHGRGDALGHQVGRRQVIVPVAQQDVVGLAHLRHETVAGGQALVVQLRVVAGDAERFQHAQRGQHLRALGHHLDHRPGEEQVDADRLEIPGVGEEQAARDDDDGQRDGRDLEDFLQQAHDGSSLKRVVPAGNSAKSKRAPGKVHRREVMARAARDPDAR